MPSTGIAAQPATVDGQVYTTQIAPTILFALGYIRGELPSMRALAAAFLRDVEAKPDLPEASAAHRVLGVHPLVRWRVRRSARASRTGARLVPAGARRRSRLSLRTGRGHRGNAVPRIHSVDARRCQTWGLPRRRSASADRGPRACRHARIWENVRGAVRRALSRWGFILVNSVARPWIGRPNINGLERPLASRIGSKIVYSCSV